MTVGVEVSNAPRYAGHRLAFADSMPQFKLWLLLEVPLQFILEMLQYTELSLQLNALKIILSCYYTYLLGPSLSSAILVAIYIKQRDSALR